MLKTRIENLLRKSVNFLFFMYLLINIEFQNKKDETIEMLK